MIPQRNFRHAAEGMSGGNLQLEVQPQQVQQQQTNAGRPDPEALRDNFLRQHHYMVGGQQQQQFTPARLQIEADKAVQAMLMGSDL